MNNRGDIQFIQETHSTIEDERKWRDEIDGKAVFSHGASNARGVMIIFKQQLEVVIVKTVTDKEGRYIIIQYEIPHIQCICTKHEI